MESVQIFLSESIANIIYSIHKRFNEWFIVTNYRLFIWKPSRNGHGLDDCIARIPSVAKVIFVALVAGEYCINYFICLNNFVLVMEVNFPKVLSIYWRWCLIVGLYCWMFKECSLLDPAALFTSSCRDFPKVNSQWDLVLFLVRIVIQFVLVLEISKHTCQME